MAKNTPTSDEELEQEMDEFLGGIRPNQYIRKAELVKSGPFEVKSVHKQNSKQYNREEWVISVALVDDPTDMLRMISFGIGNTYVDAFVKQFKKYESDGRDPGLFVLVEAERNRFRFSRPE
jgi:hypothetical protein